MPWSPPHALPVALITAVVVLLATTFAEVELRLLRPAAAPPAAITLPTLRGLPAPFPPRQPPRSLTAEAAGDAAPSAELPTFPSLR